MSDSTEAGRRQMVGEVNAVEGSREHLEAEHGPVWDTGELQREFDVLGFMAPLIVVSRKSDGVRGSIMLQHDPRF